MLIFTMDAKYEKNIFSYSNSPYYFALPCLALPCLAISSAYANEPTELETIIVSDTPFSQQIGTQKITQEKIENSPTKNGNITELLRNNPNVQFSNTSDTSKSAGEIAPNEVSINGQKFYDNNYTIDGLSNNDNINPENNNNIDSSFANGYRAIDFPSGGTQAFWIDSNLLKNVEVFDSNISAKYGRFLGGVINAEIKDPDFEKHTGRIFYRTTRDSWADFYFEEGEEEQYNKAQRFTHQPQFKKQQYGLQISQPFSKNFSVLFAYNRTESDIPFHHDQLNQWDDQRRINETYLLKGVYLTDNNDVWKATLMYSPHRSVYPKNNIKNGTFTSTGGGFSANLNWEKSFDWGKMETIFAYKKTKNEVEHEDNKYYDYSYNAKVTNPWDYCSFWNNKTGKCAVSRIGGYGHYSTQKEIWTLKQNYVLNDITALGMEHKIKFGWETEFATANYQRYQDVTNYIYQNGNLRLYEIYPARKVQASDKTYALYIEDSIQWKRLNATLGLRFDRSDFLGNNDIAPRFAISYDVFGDQKTQLFGGVNRYYSTSILAYKLRESIGSYLKCDNKKPCEAGHKGQIYGQSKLKTPYSDEYVLGFSQKFFDTSFTLKWVNRHSKEQFTRIKGQDDIQRLANQGSSKSDTLTLNIKPEKVWDWGIARINWELGFQLSKSKTNHVTYENTPEEDEFKYLRLNGKLKDINELPSLDYNTPWSGFLDVNTYFPSIRLNWTQRFSYMASGKNYKTDSKKCSELGLTTCNDPNDKVKIVDEYKQGSHFMLDWRFVYKQPIVQNQYIELSLDINNVLNRKVKASTNNSGKSTYKMGRNFWLGVSYNW